MTGTSRTGAWLVAGAAALLALAARLANLGAAFPDGAAVVPPLDDLYHAKRIVVSALGFPSVLAFDPLRGTAGGYTPWPPLYDLAAGGLARLGGARSAQEVLDRAVLFPPLAAAAVVFAATYVLARRKGLVAAATCGVLLAAPSTLIGIASVASIDHHFLEGGLLLGLIAATAAALRARCEREALLAGLVVGAALCAALFVQVALLPGAGCAVLAILLLAPGRRALAAGAAGFGLAAAVLFLWSAAQPRGYPADSWLLGLPHAAALLAAAAAMGAAALLEAGGGRARARGLGLAAGAAAFLAVPGALGAALPGAGFFRGDAWLDQVAEFQPLLAAYGGDLGAAFLDLGGAVLLAVPFVVVATRRGTPAERTVALFSAVLLLATLARVRFASQSLPVLAVAAGLFAGRLAVRSPRLAVLAVLAAAAPTLAGAVPRLLTPAPVVPPGALPALRVAGLLSAAPGPGRVLALENWGHVFNVVGRRGVLLDPFGTGGNPDYGASLSALLSNREERLEAFCRASGVRYLVLENPLLHLSGAAARAGLDPAAFLAPGAGPDAPPRLTRLLQSTVWWRAYYDHGRARPERGRSGEPLSRFVLLHEVPGAGPQPPAWGGPALQLWELREPAAAAR